MPWPRNKIDTFTTVKVHEAVMKKTFLLVDDDLVAHFVNKRLLEVSGLAEHIFTANNGLEAINYISHTFESKQVVPDIIFLDVNMPVMNGFKFIEALRKLSHIPYEKIKIVVLSSSSHDRDKEMALQLGVTDYLSKPLSAQGINNLFYAEQIGSV